MKIKSHYGMSEVLDIKKGRDRSKRRIVKFKIADPDDMYSQRVDNVWLIYFEGGLIQPTLEGAKNFNLYEEE